MKEITTDFNKNKLFRGDSIEIDCTVNFNLTGYKIRCELFDGSGSSIKRANTASGGDDTQIKINTSAATESTFTIYILKDTTDSFRLKSFIEIEFEDTDGIVETLYKKKLILNKEEITWTTP